MNAGVTKREGDRVAVVGAGVVRVGDDLDEAVAVFVRARPRLMAIAYRILRSTSEAEDVVQETWVRWQRADRAAVANPQALLATMTTRVAINVSQSAWRRRETSVDFRAREAVDTTDDPATRAERRDAVEQALLVVMGRLTPLERAAYLLREAFDYPYRQISEILHLGAANTRQLVCRARRRVAAEVQAVENQPSQQRFLLTFLSAARAGELIDLEELLAADLAG